jgi:hypothetical protein
LPILTETVTGAMFLLIAIIRHVAPDSILSILKEAPSALRARDVGIMQTSRTKTNKEYFNGNPFLRRKRAADTIEDSAETSAIVFDYAVRVQPRQASQYSDDKQSCASVKLRYCADCLM